ncbi:MAG: CarD family transcriptional regulator [Alphaproteobacteria bacterium]|nr:CarD family transcriptional regulator [Alphaproteobacteria bacterium]
MKAAQSRKTAATKSAGTKKPAAAKRPAAAKAKAGGASKSTADARDRAAKTPTAPKNKAASRKQPAKKAPAAKAAPKKKTAAKAAASKKTTSKATTKPAAKPAAKAAPKTVPKPTAKTAAKAATRPAAKTATKSAAKSASRPAKPANEAAEKPAATSTETKPAKTPKSPKQTKKQAEKAAAKAATKASVHAASGRKMMVGQKPRGERSEPTIMPTALRKAANEPGPMETQAPSPSPEAKEAKQTYKVNDHIVYPAHGVGRIVDIEKQVIAGITNELFVIDFEQEKMKLRVPTAKATAVGMRPLSEPAMIDKAIELLKGRARVKRTMWSRRAQEYEAKINSGDVISVAEVVRDLYRASDQPEQSYSERQLFEQALDRFAREVAAVRKAGLDAAIAEVEASLLQKKAA